MTEPTQKHAPTAEQDQRLELAIATLLRIGVILAAALVIVGGALTLRHPGAPARNYTAFEPPAGPATQPLQHHAIQSISGIFRQLRTGSGASIIALGLLVLIATPVARVIFAAIGFTRERDTLYTVISLVVLAILIFSLVHGT